MRLLLVNPASGFKHYQKTKIATAVTTSPYPSLVALGGAARAAGAQVAALDLILSQSPREDLLAELKRFKPDMVGTTFTSPLYYEGQEIATIAKKYNPSIITICGGSHTSSLPEETLAEGDFDLACVGEGERTLMELLDGRNPTEVNGLVIKQNGGFLHTPPREIIMNMDDLPFPAHDLFPLHRYKSTRLASKRDPIGWLETRRGCPYNCKFCSHVVGFGHKLRKKSAERAVEEFFYLRKLGCNEIHISDENFTTDLDHAKRICEMLLQRGWDRPICLPAGVRTKDLDREFIQLAVKCGLHAMAFGIESGDPRVLASVNKKQDPVEMAKAVDMCTKAGITTRGFFILGLPEDNEESMERTINYARSLNISYARASIATPFPGSPLYEEYSKKGLIISRDWSKYNWYTARDVYNHPTLKWNTIMKYFSRFYKRFFFRPSYIVKRATKGIKTGGIVRDVKYFFQTDWS